MASNHQHNQEHQNVQHEHSHESRDPGELYSQAWVQELIAKIQSFVKTSVPWLGLSATSRERVLDYACGHGTISLALASECSNLSFRGIDAHPKQVERYNNEAAKLFGTQWDRMHAVQGNLDNPSSDLDRADWNNFDVAIISMALHHVPDPVKMLTQLRQRLRTGGSLIVVEWYEASAESQGASVSDDLHPDKMIVVNGGEKIWAPFTPSGLSALLQKAGFVDVDVQKPDISFHVPEKIAEASGMPGEKKLIFVKGINGAAGTL